MSGAKIEFVVEFSSRAEGSQVYGSNIRYEPGGAREKKATGQRKLWIHCDLGETSALMQRCSIG